jgi:hypothetical protein
MKAEVDSFYQGMPVVMKALNELKSVHPFVCGTLIYDICLCEIYLVSSCGPGIRNGLYPREEASREWQEGHPAVCRDEGYGERVATVCVQIYSFVVHWHLTHISLNEVQNDKLIAPDGRTIEDRLKSLVGQTAEDIKICSNVCDSYLKKRPLAKVIWSLSWDANFAGFVELFTIRRQDFQRELTYHISESVDKINVKLDHMQKALDQRFICIYLSPIIHWWGHRLSALKDILQELVSPEHKQIWKKIDREGGIKAVQENDKILSELEKTSCKTLSSFGAKAQHTRRAKVVHQDANSNVDDLKSDIFEDPDAAAEKNRVQFDRKFNLQQDQLARVAAVVNRASNRVIQELSGGPHERIRDKVGIFLQLNSQRKTTCFLTVNSWDLERNGGRHASLPPRPPLSNSWSW